MIKHGKFFLNYYPQHMILLSILLCTIVGMLLLALPVSRLQTVSIIDLFFTSASLTTVTGMMTVTMQHFSDIGHIIMLIFMQIGGLGLMTISLLFMYMFTNLGVYTQVVASEILSIRSFKDTKHILFFMIKLTAIIEFLGAIIIFPTLYQTYSFKRAIFLSVFHSVSSFCNAGFSLFPQGIQTYMDNPIMVCTTTLLMTLGGLGFVTLHEIILKIRTGKNYTGISWHTKLVLKIYGLTTLINGIFFWMLERHNTLANMPLFQKFYTVMFASISMKSTGFDFIPFNSVHLATLVIAMIVMFIGSAPLSTGSGIKTSVFAIYIAIIQAAIMGKRHATLFGRHIVDEQVYKAMAIIALSMSWIIFIGFCLLITEPNQSFVDIVFETVSAFTNNGETRNITPLLSIMSKIFIIITMLVGRIGALAMILGMKRIADMHEISYPKEHVILG